MADHIGTVLIGCGKVGMTHAQALSELPESHFIGVYDRDAVRAKTFADQFGVKSYTKLSELLGNPDVQMASICSPHPSHPELVVSCAENGIHCLVEKPLAVDLKGCDLAISAAKNANVKLGVISQRRLYEPVQRMKNAIAAGKIGKPILGTMIVMGWRSREYYRSDPWRGKWSTEGGGVMINQTPHQMDLFQWFMGPIEELFGYWDNFNHPYIEVEDTAVAVLRFKNGALGTMLVSNSQKPGFYAKIHVHGENGATVGVQTDGGSPFIAGVTEILEPPINDIWTIPGEDNLMEQWQVEDRERYKKIDMTKHYHKLQILDFIRAILENRKPLVYGDEGRKHVEIFTAIYRSQRDKKPIKFPLPSDEGSDDFDGRLS